MNRLRNLRLDLNLSQHELANISGVSRATIQLIERGYRQPSQNELLAFAESLGVKENEILGEHNGMEVRHDKSV